MLFNSYEFIFVFFPLTFVFYFLFNRFSFYRIAQLWLVVASLIFYAWWNYIYLFVILTSICINFIFSKALLQEKRGKNILILGCSFNLLLLGYYKYTDFFIGNINAAFSQNIPLLHLALPLGISFFTFQQIAFLVDCYRRELKKIDFLQYFLFVSLFCQLIAGPIVKHKEMLPQFADPAKKRIDFHNINVGLFIFFCGLMKKLVLADTLSTMVDYGFDSASSLAFIDAWMVSLSYTMQLYFDFSGYVDMATGIALMLNITLPVNFLSPYCSVNISDFWRRWHVTLGRFLRNCLYIPLGGNRGTVSRTAVNILLTFLLGGIWHGAGWMFLVWGFAHGVAVLIHRLWVKSGQRMSSLVGGVVTFLFVNFAWVIFRATNINDALKVFKGMFNPDIPGSSVLSENPYDFYTNLIVLSVSLLIVFILPNTEMLKQRFQPKPLYLLYITIAFAVSFVMMEKQSPFLYWQF